MNVKRLLALVVLVTTLVSSTEELHAMRRRPAAAAPARRHAAPVVAAPVAPAARSIRLKYVAIALATTAVVVLTTWLAARAYYYIPATSGFVMPSSCDIFSNKTLSYGSLSTNNTGLIETCYRGMSSLAQGTYVLLQNCLAKVKEEQLSVTREQIKCNLLPSQIEALTAQVHTLKEQLSQAVCPVVGNALSAVESTLSSVFAWRPY